MTPQKMLFPQNYEKVYKQKNWQKFHTYWLLIWKIVSGR